MTETLKSVAEELAAKARGSEGAESVAWRKAHAAVLALVARVERIHAKTARDSLP